MLSMDALADFLKEKLRASGPIKKDAAVILPDSLVFCRNITVPPMTDAQLNYNLPFEFKDYLNQEKSRYYFDYAVQGTEKDESGETTGLRLFACATLKKTVEDYRAMFYRAGYKLKLALPRRRPSATWRPSTQRMLPGTRTCALWTSATRVSGCSSTGTATSAPTGRWTWASGTWSSSLPPSGVLTPYGPHPPADGLRKRPVPGQHPGALQPHGRGDHEGRELL